VLNVVLVHYAVPDAYAYIHTMCTDTVHTECYAMLCYAMLSSSYHTTALLDLTCINIQTSHISHGHTRNVM
jgi:hypothetical protein